MDGAVAAEDENRVGLIRVCRRIDEPVRLRILLKRLQVFGGSSRPEDGSCAHVRGRLSDMQAIAELNAEFLASRVGALIEKAVQ